MAMFRLGFAFQIAFDRRVKLIERFRRRGLGYKRAGFCIVDGTVGSTLALNVGRAVARLAAFRTTVIVGQ